MKDIISNLRNIPSVDELLRSELAAGLIDEQGFDYAAELARGAQARLREGLRADTGTGPSKEDLMISALSTMAEISGQESSRRMQKVINCTGVVIHTNLGRAPLSDAAAQAISREAFGYCTLEYDLQTGRRGKRGEYCEHLIAELIGAEAALVVNNCAAAAFFVLTALGAGSEVVISRGELVEIGGDFRIPDVLVQSGATLREVGTTNRTKLVDYEAGLDNGAKLILRVHPSNYKITGFTSKPSLSELSALAKDRGVILYEDIGSGAIIDLSDHGLTDEPVVAYSIAAGADIVTFSGGKLLGGPQAGIIAGRRELIEALRRHPLYRTLRVGKLIYAGLEATLTAYRSGKFTDIPVISMISQSLDSTRERSKRFVENFNQEGPAGVSIELSDGVSAVGGGAAAGVALQTTLIKLKHSSLSADALERSLRTARPSVITRIENDRVLIDLRTVFPAQEAILMETLRSIG